MLTAKNNSGSPTHRGESQDPITVIAGQTADAGTITLEPVNNAPVADAGPDQTVDEGVTVTLDGSNSWDPEDGSELSYLWEQTVGPSVTLSDPTAVQPTFTAPDVGPGGISLTFQLTVTDSGSLQDTDTCIVNIDDLGPATIDFEDLTLGAEYQVPDVFTTSGIPITAKPFQWSNGTWYSGGWTRVVNTGDAGGSGKEMWVNNINLDFGFPGPLLSGLSLLFGEYGGNLNIEINGDFRNFENFVEINGDIIGGVSVSVVNGLGNDMGSLTLKGTINQFAIGGQEFAIDDVQYQ